MRGGEQRGAPSLCRQASLCPLDLAFLVELGASRDARVLGVAVRRIVMREGRRLRMIEAADTALDNGFHLLEPDNAFCWTDGDALVPTAIFADVYGVCEVGLHIGCTARYVADAAAA